MKLTEEKKQQFVDWLKSTGVNVDILKCQVCAGNEFGVLNDIVLLPTGTESAYANVGLICTTCKNITLFEATESGVMDEEKIDTPETAPVMCSKCLYEKATVQSTDGEALCSECYNGE